MGATAVVAKVLPGPEQDPLIDRHNLIGKPLPRIRPNTGSTDWSTRPSCIVPSRRGNSSIDSQAAEQLPGVLAVMTYRNAPRMQSPKSAGPLTVYITEYDAQKKRVAGHFSGTLHYYDKTDRHETAAVWAQFQAANPY